MVFSPQSSNSSSISQAAWHGALVRWGDILFGLAALVTNQRTAAETLVVQVACQVFAGQQQPDTEDTLYAALAAHAHKRQPWRQHMLPRSLARITSPDRLMLGLWLLRDIGGTRLATLCNLAPDVMVQRVVALLKPLTAPLPSRTETPDCVTLQVWVSHELGLATMPAEHIRICSDCQAAIASWQTTVDALRDTLREVTAAYRLPQTCVERIERCLFERQEGAAPHWWQHAWMWYIALVVIVGMVVIGLITAREYTPTLVSSTPPLDARGLVQAAMTTWTSPEISGTLHLQARASELGSTGRNATVTDVWMSGPQTTSHMIQVHRGDNIVEWQLGDGTSRFYYGATPAESSCPWRLNLIGQRDTSAFMYRLNADQQRVVRDARLQQGNYATGLLALKQALAASDLRSFGTSPHGKNSFAVLSYTDTSVQPHRQIVLRIDPIERQLHIVQVVIDDGGRTTSYDLWRLQVRDKAAMMPAGLPQWQAPEERQQLLDPTCPALDPSHILSLRTLIDRPEQQWYLPRSLPENVTRAGAFSFPLRDPSVELAQNSLVFLGTDRWLSVSAGTWTSNVTSTTDLQRGSWRITLQAQGKDGWKATARQFPENLPIAFVPAVDIASRGWSQDELLAFIDTLSPATVDIWRSIHDRFLEPSPLPPPTQTAIERSLTALQPPPDHTLYSLANIYIRAAPYQPPVSDPYATNERVRNPSSLRREQWLVYSGGNVARVYDIFSSADSGSYTPTINDGSASTYEVDLYKATIGDANHLTFDYRAQGWAGTDTPSQPHSYLTTEQVGVEMVENLLRAYTPISLTNTADGLLLEQTSLLRDAGLDYEFFSHELPVPWTGDLPEGHFVRRLWLDRNSFLPRRLQIVHLGKSGRETVLFRIDLRERQLSDIPSPNQIQLPPRNDELLFNSTATRWRQARLVVPPLSIHWLMSNLDAPSGPSLIDSYLEQARVTRILTWPTSSNPFMLWHLFPATAVNLLQVGALQANTWNDLAQLSSVDRSQYRMSTDGNITIRITQGPAKLLKHILRYPPLTQERSVVGWTRSEQLEVEVAGQRRDAWLLQNGQAAVLVVEVDDQLLHIVGPPDYLRGPLLDLLPQMVWSDLGE